MSYFFGGLLGVVLLGALVAGLVMSIIALTRTSSTNGVLTTPTLIHPRGGNATSAPPTVAVFSGTAFGSPTMTAGSTDTSGGVSAILTAAAGAVAVTFGTRYAVAPKAVLVTATTSSPTYTVTLAVENLTATGFVVRGTPGSPTTLTDVVFYYMVL